jgi:hypothetical protein
MTAVMTNIVVASLLDNEERSFGDLSLSLSGDIHLENGRNIHLEDFYSGNFNSASSDLSGLLTSLLFFLMNNEFQDLGVYRIDLNVRTSEEVKFSYLEKVWLDKYDVNPGERVWIKVYSRNYRGESVMRDFSILAPNLPAGSTFYLVVGDSQAMRNVEFAQYRRQTFVPRSLDQLLRMLNSLRKNNRIYFKIYAPKPGLFLKGEELPNLPPTLKSMFTSPRSATSVPIEIRRSTLQEYQHRIPAVFQGAAMIPLKIKK